MMLSLYVHRYHREFSISRNWAVRGSFGGKQQLSITQRLNALSAGYGSYCENRDTSRICVCEPSVQLVHVHDTIVYRTVIAGNRKMLLAS